MTAEEAKSMTKIFHRFKEDLAMSTVQQRRDRSR